MQMAGGPGHGDTGLLCRGGRVLLREDCLRFRATAKQCLGSVAGTIILAAVAVGLAALAHWRFGLESALQGWDISVAVVCLGFVWISICLPLAFTELSPSGVRARGFAGPRNCSWPQVAAIGVETIRGTRTIIVTRHDRSGFRRSRFRLTVPADRSPFMSDADFTSKFSAIWYYWQEATISHIK